MKTFCKHEWAEKEKIINNSAYEQMGRNTDNLSNAPMWLFEKEIFIIYECKKCGKLKKFSNK